LCHATESGAEEVEREEERIDPLETVAWGWLVVAMEIRIGRKMKMRKCSRCLQTNDLTPEE
jgi:hypothetical protein